MKTAVTELHGVGEVATSGERLAQVYYELQPVGPEAPAELIGRLTLLTGNWWTLASQQAEGLRLQTREGRWLPFRLTQGAHPDMFWIRVPRAGGTELATAD